MVPPGSQPNSPLCILAWSCPSSSSSWVTSWCLTLNPMDWCTASQSSSPWERNDFWVAGILQLIHIHLLEVVFNAICTWRAPHSGLHGPVGNNCQLGVNYLIARFFTLCSIKPLMGTLLDTRVDGRDWVESRCLRGVWSSAAMVCIHLDRVTVRGKVRGRLKIWLALYSQMADRIEAKKDFR